MPLVLNPRYSSLCRVLHHLTVELAPWLPPVETSNCFIRRTRLDQASSPALPGVFVVLRSVPLRLLEEWGTSRRPAAPRGRPRRPSGPGDTERWEIAARYAMNQNQPNSRRTTEGDRRQVSRSGRRQTDPVPQCASCGLGMWDGLHASDADCVVALRTELERLRALLADTRDPVSSKLSE